MFHQGFAVTRALQNLSRALSFQVKIEEVLYIVFQL